MCRLHSSRVELFIDGKYVPSANGATFAVVNPATDEDITRAPAGTAADVDLAVAAARAGIRLG